MKNFLQLSLLFAVCLSATPTAAQTSLKLAPLAPQQVDNNPKPIHQPAKAPAARLPLATQDVVNDTPSGKLFANQAYANTYHYYNFDGEVESGESNAILIDYVLAPDGTIWLHSPISLMETGWVRLDRVTDSTYVAHTPQAVMEDAYDTDDEGNPYKSYATRLVLKNFGDGYYYYPDTIGEGQYNLDIMFTYKNGVIRQVQDSLVADMSSMPYEVLGLTYADGSWLGYADGNMRVYPINEPTAQIPDGIEPKIYVLTDSTLNGQTGKLSVTRQLVHMATSGNDAYLAAPDGSGGWIHGTYQKDGSISFGRQYLGPSTLYNSHLWFRPANYSVQNSAGSEGEPWGVSFDFTDELVLRPTADGLAAAAADALVINAAADRVLYAASYLAPSLKTFNEVAATPANPNVYEFYPYDEDMDFSLVTVQIPVVDTAHNLLNTSKLSFVIYYDDATAPHTFDASYYQNMAENTTEIPYSFQDGNDFFISENGHTIYINDANPQRVGVQSIYRGAGVERRSDIVWSDGEITSSIASPTLSTAASQKAALTVYDLQGRKLEKPIRGLNLVRMDGGAVKKMVVK